jgi:hypothetical protein
MHDQKLQFCVPHQALPLPFPTGRCRRADCILTQGFHQPFRQPAAKTHLRAAAHTQRGPKPPNAAMPLRTRRSTPCAWPPPYSSIAHHTLQPSSSTVERVELGEHRQRLPSVHGGAHLRPRLPCRPPVSL